MWPWCGQMGVGGWVGMITFWVAVVAVAIWAVTRLFPVADASPRRTLDDRLARGEIDPATYRIIRDELGHRDTAERGAR